MKKAGFVILIGCLMGGCHDSGSSSDHQLDSIGQKLDSSAGRVWDSTKAKARDLKERIEDKLENKDAAGKADTTQLKF